MSQPCPICGKPVDTIRAPAVKVRAGKVVAFCSAECAKAGETQPTVVPPVAPTVVPPAVPTPKRTPASGVVKPIVNLDSGPVIEIIHEPASGVVTSAKDERVPLPPTLPAPAEVKPREDTKSKVKAKDDTLDKWTMTDDEVIDSSARASTAVPLVSNSRAPLIIVLVLIAVAAGGFLAYRFLYANRGVSAATGPAAGQLGLGSADAIAPDAPPPAPSPEVAVSRARHVLTVHVKSDSPRVQRVAAAALGRTGDATAIQTLVDALAHEASDVAKLDIAYALARAGDKHGSEALAAAAGAGRSRDVRAEASRRLAQLGDPRAIPTLASFLDVSQLRLGAAEQLAYLAEPRALKVLDQVRADAKSLPDDKARATIALGIAGRTDVAAELRVMLGNQLFNAPAAIALALQHDQAARPVLLKHLTIPSFRVDAARALRRLDPSRDPAPQLAELLAELDSDKDTDQISVAEAILLLAGPVEWSLRP